MDGNETQTTEPVGGSVALPEGYRRLGDSELICSDDLCLHNGTWIPVPRAYLGRLSQFITSLIVTSRTGIAQASTPRNMYYGAPDMEVAPVSGYKLASFEERLAGRLDIQDQVLTRLASAVEELTCALRLARVIK